MKGSCFSIFGFRVWVSLGSPKKGCPQEEGAFIFCLIDLHRVIPVLAAQI